MWQITAFRNYILSTLLPPMLCPALPDRRETPSTMGLLYQCTPHTLTTTDSQGWVQTTTPSSISVCMTKATPVPACWEISKGLSPTSGLCTQVPALTDSCCVHTGIPCICPVTTFPLPELQCWQLLGSGSWHFKCYVRPLAAPFAAAKGKATLINARKSSVTPTAEWPLKPQKAADVQDTAHCKTRTRLSLESHRASGQF